MGKSAILAAGLATYGSYQAAQLFVPAAPSTSSASSSSSSSTALRGASASSATVSDAKSLPALPAGLTVAGALGLLAAGRSSVRRRAAATAEVEAPPPFDPAKQVGVTAPLGFFDPLGFSKVGDEEGFRKLRAAERKHGRVAMMAAVGAVFQHYIQFPTFQSGPKGLAVLTTTPGMVGSAVLVGLCGVLELFFWTEKPDEEPGDFGNPFSLERDLKTGGPVYIGAGPRDRELNNGRMAMISIAGIMAAELATGKDAIEQFF
eukprot:TRINITY_DN446_c0_g1_i1.p1 TRINITY_DN446_c0_g1~~TRINITY_DN446_c0_g1_i1.p1  ORF type:complete len:294 (+),score=94.72 TRINITY_DN446_c0_g1_i1:101-883(+)